MQVNMYYNSVDREWIKLPWIVWIENQESIIKEWESKRISNK